MLVSLVLGLGLEHSCPWPRECLSSERLSLALASVFFCVLGLGLGFFLCPWPWPRALCPRLHLCTEDPILFSQKHLNNLIRDLCISKEKGSSLHHCILHSIKRTKYDWKKCQSKLLREAQ